MKEIPVVNLIEMLHFMLLSLWGGVVITEAVIELYPYKEKTLHDPAVIFHFYIDIFVEGPLLLGVLLTGGILAWSIKLTALHYIKITAGLTALTMNFICIALVIKRKLLKDRGVDKNVLWRYSRYIITAAVIGIPAAMVAIYLGLTLGHQRMLHLINMAGM
jgi:hypothetical protein